MRQVADAARIHALMRELARDADVAGRVYFTGGATAVLYGWRPATIDVDLSLVPEHDRLFRALASLKERLQINVELAAPSDFIPVPEGWESRSPFVAQEGRLSFHHYDLYSQALAKTERGHALDVADVREMVARGLVEARRAAQYFEEIEPLLYRYPAVDPAAFRRAVEEMFGPA
jgi:hypothetical protein